MDPNENTNDIVDTSNLPDFHGLLDFTDRFLQNFPVNDINTLIEKIYKEREEAELSEFYSNCEDDTVFDINNLEKLDMYDFENPRMDDYDNLDEPEEPDEQDNYVISDEDDFTTV